MESNNNNNNNNIQQYNYISIYIFFIFITLLLCKAALPSKLQWIWIIALACFGFDTILTTIKKKLIMNNNNIYYLSHYIYANLLCFRSKDVWIIVIFIIITTIINLVYFIIFMLFEKHVFHLNCSYENEWLWKVNRNNYANMLSMFLFVISTLMESGVIVDAIL